MARVVKTRTRSAAAALGNAVSLAIAGPKLLNMLDPIPQQATVGTTMGIPVCPYYYAWNDECFEIRKPHWADNEGRRRCKLPRPIPALPWCVGDEGKERGYSYTRFDEEGRTRMLRMPEYAPDVEELAREKFVDIWSDSYASRRHLRTNIGPQSVYLFGKKGPLYFKPLRPDHPLWSKGEVDAYGPDKCVTRLRWDRTGPPSTSECLTAPRLISKYPEGHEPTF